MNLDLTPKEWEAIDEALSYAMRMAYRSINKGLASTQRAKHLKEWMQVMIDIRMKAREWNDEQSINAE
jgi:hypothetical protein